MISFVVPAHNEEAYLPATLAAIHQSARAVGKPYEIIVADDASTAATAQIAHQQGARVVSVNNRQIAATRNSGARAANGEQIFFVDADTIVNTRAVTAALRCMDKGAVGGGAPTWLGKNERVPLYIRLLAAFAIVFAKPLGFTGGAFMFCTREAFRATGGFNEHLFWGEEGDFGLALKREGRFVALWCYVLTSGRRFRTTSGLQVLATLGRTLMSPRKMFTRRSSVEKIWYDSNRKKDHIAPNSIAARISNGIALVVLLAVFSGPLWNFIPESLTPLSSPFGKLRLVTGIFLCHLGLILWPVAILLFVNLLRQKRFAGSLHNLALIAFCAWQAWGSTLGFIWVWGHAYHWLAG